MWLGVAGCRLTCCSAATAMAGYGLTRPCDCGRWLLVRLPGFWLATLTFVMLVPLDGYRITSPVP